MIVDENTKICVGDTGISHVYQGDTQIYSSYPYTKLEYIKCNTRGPYIDTGVIVNGIDISFQYDGNFETENSLFGARDTESSRRFGMLTQPDNNFHLMPPGINFGKCKNGQKQHLTMGAYFNWVITIDDESMVCTDTSWSSTKNCWLFRENTGVTRQGWNIRLYYCKLYYNNTLVRDFIPVLDPSGIPCLYDYVSKNYFYNNGTGAFSFKEKQTPYCRVSYLASNQNYKQYIDTGFKPTSSDVKIQTKFRSNYQNGPVFGNYYFQNNYYCTIITAYGDKWYFSGYNPSSCTYTLQQDHEVEVQVQAGTSSTHDGIYTIKENNIIINTGNKVGPFPPTNTILSSLYLFSQHTGSQIESFNSSVYIYYFKIYDNNKLVRDFIPVLDNNNIKCINDRVNNKLYYNQGTGQFLYG